MKTLSEPSRRSVIGKIFILTGVVAGGVVFSRSFLRNRLELKKALKVAEVHLLASEKATGIHLEERLNDIRAFFDGAKDGGTAFAEAMLSWGSKWKLIKDKALFWRKENRHGEFIKAKFSELVFRSEDLAKTVQTAIEDFVERDAAAVNNELLTNIRKDVSIHLVDSEGDPEQFVKRASIFINEAFAEAARAVYKDLGAESGSFLASSIATTVLVRVGASIATRLGLSATLIGAGATAGSFTLGIAFVAAIVVDLALSWAIDFFTDPVGDLAEMIRTELDVLENLVVEGSPADELGAASVGLRQELEIIEKLQSASRRKTIVELLDANT